MDEEIGRQPIDVLRRSAMELKRRCDVADEMLAALINDIGTGPGLAPIRQQALDIKHELRGLVRERFSTAP